MPATVDTNESSMLLFGNFSSTTLPPISHSMTTLRNVVLAIYLVTFFFGLVGNTLTVVVVIRYKKMHNVANLFMLNLAIADNLFVLNLPFMAHSTFSKRWVFGSVLCKLMSASYGTNLYASIFTMVLMSVDRLLAGAWPLRSMRYRTARKAVVVCSLIWVICTIIMTPYWMYADTHTSANGSLNCRIDWPATSRLKHIWFWTNFELIVGFILPIILMVFSYGMLVHHLFRNHGIFQNQSRTPIKRVTLMVSLVTIIFIVCWTPYHILRYNSTKKKTYFMSNTNPELPSDSDKMRFAIFSAIANALVFVSSCCNPVIYGISSKSFRQLYLDVLCRCCPRYQPLPRTRSQINASYSTRMSIMERSRSAYDRTRNRETALTNISGGNNSRPLIPMDEPEPETLMLNA